MDERAWDVRAVRAWRPSDDGVARRPGCGDPVAGLDVASLDGRVDRWRTPRPTAGGVRPRGG